MKILPIIFLAFLFSLTFASCELQFWQVKEDMGNNLYKNEISACYTKGIGELPVLNGINDYVSGDNPFEAYLLYNIYVQGFNADNPNYTIDWCSFSVQKSSALTTFSTLLNQTYTNSDGDMMHSKFFVQMDDKDCILAQQICKFNVNVTITPNNKLIFPAEMQFVAPTWECKSCQAYEWSLVERDIVKADSIGDNVVGVTDYIKKLIFLNYEIVLIFFWIFLILMIFAGIGLIFFGISWLYNYLRSIIK
jgi:hypothetical protein